MAKGESQLLGWGGCCGDSRGLSGGTHPHPTRDKRFQGALPPRVPHRLQHGFHVPRGLSWRGAAGQVAAPPAVPGAPPPHRGAPTQRGDSSAARLRFGQGAGPEAGSPLRNTGAKEAQAGLRAHPDPTKNPDPMKNPDPTLHPDPTSRCSSTQTPTPIKIWTPRKTQTPLKTLTPLKSRTPSEAGTPSKASPQANPNPTPPLSHPSPSPPRPPPGSPHPYLGAAAQGAAGAAHGEPPAGAAQPRGAGRCIPPPRSPPPPANGFLRGCPSRERKKK